MKLFAHQDASVRFLDRHARVFDMSDPGTGKTGVQITAFARRAKKTKKRGLVLAPKSLLWAAWAADVKKFAPQLTVAVAEAGRRLEAFESTADLVIMNFDGVKELSRLPQRLWRDFDTLIIDESTAFKHQKSQRAKCLVKALKHFPIRRLMSGTPSPNGICDLWHQVFLLDAGQRLGKSFNGFRAACCIPTQTGPAANMLRWDDKPGVEALVISLIQDITIRHRFEDCVDIPANHQYAVPVRLSPAHQALYDRLERDALLPYQETTITAINGAALATKLLQIASGAVYNDDGDYSQVATERYELALDLAEARPQVVIFYLWAHQLKELQREANARELSAVVWDPAKPEIAADFQAGRYRILFAHPQSAGHGLTLTRAVATIWPSPTHNLEHYLQGLKRVHRIGQTQKTETIVLVADGTVDERAWARLQSKKSRLDSLFEAVAEQCAA